MPTYDESISLDAVSYALPYAQLNPITWSVGEKIYFDNRYKMSDEKLFDNNYLPDDIVIMEAIS